MGASGKHRFWKQKSPATGVLIYVPQLTIKRQSMRIRYARVSTQDQSLGCKLDQLTGIGCGALSYLKISSGTKCKMFSGENISKLIGNAHRFANPLLDIPM